MKQRFGMRDILLTAAISAASAPPSTFFYGGQAVLEGVLMRGRTHYAVAARRPDGRIALHRDLLRSRVYTSPMWSKPFLRGVAGLYETLHLGMRALQWSARVQLGDDVELGAAPMRAAMLIALCFALLLFVGAPLLFAGLLRRGHTQSITTVLIEGVIRGVILILYIVAIGRIRNIQRLFQYHGAEHKSINCLEAGNAVIVANVRPASRLHPRCGTGFLVVVALVSALVFAPLGLLPTAVRILCQIVLIPIVAAIAYEAIRGLARIRHTAIGEVLLAPVLATQLLSTREPDDAQIEVAITALDAARGGGPAVSESHVVL